MLLLSNKTQQAGDCSGIRGQESGFVCQRQGPLLLCQYPAFGSFALRKEKSEVRAIRGSELVTGRGLKFLRVEVNIQGRSLSCQNLTLGLRDFGDNIQLFGAGLGLVSWRLTQSSK